MNYPTKRLVLQLSLRCDMGPKKIDTRECTLLLLAELSFPNKTLMFAHPRDIMNMINKSRHFVQTKKEAKMTSDGKTTQRTYQEHALSL